MFTATARRKDGSRLLLLERALWQVVGNPAVPAWPALLPRWSPTHYHVRTNRPRKAYSEIISLENGELRSYANHSNKLNFSPE